MDRRAASIDVVNQTYTVACRTEVTEKGQRRTLKDRATLRMIWPQEMRALAEANGFQLAKFYGALDEKLAIDDPKAWRTVAVFVRV